MLRILGGMLLAAGSGLWGLESVWRLSRRRRELEWFWELSGRLQGQLGYSLAPPDALLRQAGSRPPGPELCKALERQGEGPFSRRWQAAVASREWALAPEERQMVEQLGQVLGAWDAAAQCPALAQLEQRCGTYLRQLEETGVPQARLRRTLGLLGGLAVWVLLW